jgi:hypothetical protein
MIELHSRYSTQSRDLTQERAHKVKNCTCTIRATCEIESCQWFCQFRSTGYFIIYLQLSMYLVDPAPISLARYLMSWQLYVLQEPHLSLVTCFFADWNANSGCVRKDVVSYLPGARDQAPRQSLTLKSLKPVRDPFC